MVPAFPGADCKGVLETMGQYIASEACHMAVPGNNRNRMREERSPGFLRTLDIARRGHSPAIESREVVGNEVE